MCRALKNLETRECSRVSCSTKCLPANALMLMVNNCLEKAATTPW